ncbi:hypothetical protein V6N12_075189 [Hibiscus sabdariffa]|uniref:Pentatricopeptide repeat-containing protein n=1 Tax=Hibiscus sabdariffa TaxID=183260 RepID=A0ABR2BZZ2_9ROSI
MKSNGIQPDRHFYNVMIDTFGKYNCLDHAMATFDRMLSEGIGPDTVTWNTLIDCHCKAGWHDGAEQLFEEMKEKGVSCPYLGHKYMLVYILHQREAELCVGLSEQAMNVLRVTGADGLKPNRLALNSLINAFGEDRRVAEAFAVVLQYMKENGVKPDAVTYTTLMKALIRIDKFHKVPAVYEEMVLSGCTPDRKARAMLRSAPRYTKRKRRSHR